MHNGENKNILVSRVKYFLSEVKFLNFQLQVSDEKNLIIINVNLST
jgi:hypothetical protein